MAAADPGEQINCPGPARSHSYPGDAGDASGSVGGEGRGLLMVHADNPDLLELVKRIQHVSDHAAGKFVNIPYATAIEESRDVVRGLDHGVRKFSSPKRSLAGRVFRKRSHRV